MKPVTAFNTKARPVLSGYEPSQTQQHMAEACNINSIMERVKRGAMLPIPNKGSALYGDFSNVPSYEDALNRVRQADEEFMHLPAKIRDRFQNNPARLIDFLQDENNRTEAEELGLIDRKEPSKEGSKNEAHTPT